MFTLASGLEDSMRALAEVFSRLDALAHPDELLPRLAQLPVVLAGIFVAAGLVCLLQGFKLYKGVVIALALLVGLAVGYRLGQIVEAEMIVAGCLGVLLAVLAWPLMKYAVAIAGGVAGAFMGANAYAAITIEAAKHGHNLDPSLTWVGALGGLMVVGLLSFLLFQVAVVIFTSVSGSVLAVLGIFALLMQVPGWGDGIVRGLTNSPIVLPLLVIVPAVIGLVLQQQRGALKRVEATGGEGKVAVAGGKKS